MSPGGFENGEMSPQRGGDQVVGNQFSVLVRQLGQDNLAHTCSTPLPSSCYESLLFLKKHSKILQSRFSPLETAS